MGYKEIYQDWLSDERLNEEAKAELDVLKDNALYIHHSLQDYA